MGHQVHGGGRWVGAPDHDQPRVPVVLVGDTRHPAVQGGRHGAGRRGANGARQTAGAELAEQLCVGGVLGDEPVRAAVGERQDRLAAPAAAGLRQLVRHHVERFVPGHVPEARLALGSGAQPGPQQAILAIYAGAEAAHLAANRTGRHVVARRCVDAGDPAVLDRDRQAAGVRTVERTGRLDRYPRPRPLVVCRHPFSLQPVPVGPQGAHSAPRRTRRGAKGSPLAAAGGLGRSPKW